MAELLFIRAKKKKTNITPTHTQGAVILTQFSCLGFPPCVTMKSQGIRNEPAMSQLDRTLPHVRHMSDTCD